MGDERARRSDASGELAHAHDDALVRPSLDNRVGKGRSVAQAYGRASKSTSSRPIAPGRVTLAAQLAKPRPGAASPLAGIEPASSAPIASFVTALAATGAQALALGAALAEREQTTRVKFARTRTEVFAAAREQTTAVHADFDAAIATLHDQTDRPLDALDDTAAAERGRLDAAALAASMMIAAATSRTVASTYIADHAARAATHPRNEREADAVTEGLHAARHSTARSVHAEAGWVSQRILGGAASRSGTMRDDAAQARAGVAHSLDDLHADLARARDAVIAHIEKMAFAQVGQIDAAEQQTVAALGRTREQAQRRLAANDGAGDAIAHVVGAVDEIVARIGAALGDAVAELAADAERTRTNARTSYSAAAIRLTEAIWPDVEKARRGWQSQTDAVIVGALAAAAQISARLHQVESGLPAHFTAIAEAAIADRRLTGPEILVKHVGRALDGAIHSLQPFIELTLAGAAIVAAVFGIPIWAALALAAAAVGEAMLLKGFIESFIDRVDKLSDEWGGWPWYDKLGAIIASIPAAASDAFGYTGAVEATTHRDSTTGRKLSDDEASARGDAALGNLALGELTGHALRRLSGARVGPEDTTSPAEETSDEVSAEKEGAASTESKPGSPARVTTAGPQRTGDLEHLYRDAAIAQQSLAVVTSQIAEAVGGRALIPSVLKGRARAVEKIAASYGGDASRITDLARASVVVDNVEQVARVVKEIERRCVVIHMKDRFAKPQDGYRDILFTLEMPNGHVAELQIQLEAIQVVKDGPGHKLYEEVRTIRDRATIEKRAFTSAELRRLRSLETQMKGLYDRAYESANEGGDADR